MLHADLEPCLGFSILMASGLENKPWTRTELGGNLLDILWFQWLVLSFAKVEKVFQIFLPSLNESWTIFCFHYWDVSHKSSISSFSWKLRIARDVGLASRHDDTGWSRGEVAAIREHAYSATVAVPTRASFVSLAVLGFLFLTVVTFRAPRRIWVWNMVCSNNEKLTLQGDIKALIYSNFQFLWANSPKIAHFQLTTCQHVVTWYEVGKTCI